MNRDGHLGAALLAFAPLGLALTRTGAVGMAALGAALAVGLAMVPDYDQRVPGIAHRGVTHTLAFAFAFGLAVGTAAGAFGEATGVELSGSMTLYGLELVSLQSYASLVGTVAVLSHLAADALTPSGVPLLYPLSDRRFSLALVTADDAVANYALLVGGAAGSLLWARGLLGV